MRMGYAAALETTATSAKFLLRSGAWRVADVDVFDDLFEGDAGREAVFSKA